MDIYKVLIEANYILKWSKDNTVIEVVPIKNMSLEDRKEAFIKRLAR